MSCVEAEKATAEQKEGKLIRGIMVKEVHPEYCDRYQALVDSLQNKEEVKK
jgi:hypothetical protein